MQIIDDKFEIRPQEKNPGESSTFPLTSAGSCWIDREKEVEQGEKQGTPWSGSINKVLTPWSLVRVPKQGTLHPGQGPQLPNLLFGTFMLIGNQTKVPPSFPKTD